MASGPFTSWKIEREKVEAVTDFLISKITVDGECSHESKMLLLGRKAMTSLDSILKSRDIIAFKGLYSESYDFSSSHI